MLRIKYKLCLLLICLALIIFIYPIFEKSQEAGKLLGVFFTAVLVSAVYAISENNRKIFFISLILAISAVTLFWLDQFYPKSFKGQLTVDILSNASMVIFTFFTAGCILAHIMRTKKVTSDILAGAACTYLLFGISWGMLYSLVEQVMPGSFSVGLESTTRVITSHDWSVFNYFSFITLTTLGYGDITPVTSRAQSLAILESVTGVLFVALLVSRLVGVYITQNIKREEE